MLAPVLCLSLTACGDSNGEDEGRGDLIPDDVSGADWRTTGIWRSDGTITCDGEDTNVLVCIHKEDAING